MRLALIFNKTREDTIGVYFERACRQLGVAYDQFWMWDAERIPPDYALYLRIDHGDYSADLPARLRPRVFYATDTHLPHAWNKIQRLAPRYELVCCAHRQGAERLANGVWVPVGCDPELHGPPPLLTVPRSGTHPPNGGRVAFGDVRGGGAKRWDVAFIGTEGGVPRKFLLQALRERYSRSRIGHAPHTELGAIYSRARIGFNYSIRDDVNMRMFEVLCGGALLVTNALSHDDLGRLGLDDREHLALYRRPGELFEVMDYYLAHEQEREAIAARGQAAVQEHTYARRLTQIFGLIQERVGFPVPAAAPQEGQPCVSS